MNALKLWELVTREKTILDLIDRATPAHVAEAQNRRSKHWEGENERHETTL